MNNTDLDYADGELMRSIQELLVNAKASKGLTYQTLDGSDDPEGKTARNYLKPDYLANMIPLKSQTVQKLNLIIANALLTTEEILNFHKERIAATIQTNNQKGRTHQTINFNGEIKGHIFSGNETVHVTIGK